MLETDRVKTTVSRKFVGWALLGLALCVCQSGCVQRRMVVRSNPPGALVYVDDYPEPIGVTPCATNFTYYGTRRIRLVKDNYETLTVMQPIPAPWYQYTPFDFITENFVPGEIRDQRVVEYQLKPQMVVPSEQLIARGEELRRGIHAATGTTSQLSGGSVRGPSPIGPSGSPPMNGEVVPAPQGIGGQQVHPLPPSGGQ
jgi:hypothetical protein